MSRRIDLTKKLSDEDRQYLKSWGRYEDIRINDLEFGRPESQSESESVAESGAGSEAEGPTKYTEEWFDKATVATLQAELKDRGLAVSGKRDELADRLFTDMDAKGQLPDEDDETT